jgi:uncharacterized integral membrane protein
MNNDPDNFSQPPIARLILLAVAIACIAAILLQNLQPLVTAYFLGRSTIPIPLSLAILGAFLSGVISAAIANSVANWLSRRNDYTETDSNSATNNNDVKPKEKRRSQVKDEEVEDSTSYPRSGSDRTTKLQDDDDFDDDDDDDDRDEIFVKYIKRP